MSNVLVRLFKDSGTRHLEEDVYRGDSASVASLCLFSFLRLSVSLSSTSFYNENYNEN